MGYEVDFNVPNRPLGKSDIRFIVRTKEEGVLGTLRISKGALVWFPKKTNYGHKISWQQFAKIAAAEFPHKEYRSGT